ncbi:hypothetical protein AB9T88_08800 [Flavobacterium sp. LBUM151]
MNFIQLKNIALLQKDKIILSAFAVLFSINIGTSQNTFPDIVKTKEGKLSFTADAKGNQIPDFSYAGYMASEKAIPNVENKFLFRNKKKMQLKKFRLRLIM